jgi:hypothetical protein
MKTSTALFFALATAWPAFGAAPPKAAAGTTILKFLSPSVDIATSGDYALDRDWNVQGLSLRITADNVTLDMRGYSLADGDPSITISGNNVTIRNGTVSGASPLTTVGGGTVIDSVALRGRTGGTVLGGEQPFGGDAFPIGGGYLVRRSTLGCEACTAVRILAPGVTIESSRLGGGQGALYMGAMYDLNNDESDHVIVVDNLFDCLPGNAHCVMINGIGTTFARNTFGGGGSFYLAQDPMPPLILINGSHHLILDNTVLMFGIGSYTLMEVRSGESIIRDTTVASSGLWQVGINFVGAGNAFGGNYVGGPFVGSENQFDLGGNVSR